MLKITLTQNQRLIHHQPTTSPFFQWCGSTSFLWMVWLHLLYSLNGATAPLFPFSMVRLHLLFEFSMVQLHLSLLSQWCGCTFLFSLNQSLSLCPYPHPITLYYLSKNPFSSLRSAFFLFFYAKLRWQVSVVEMIFLPSVARKKVNFLSLFTFEVRDELLRVTQTEPFSELCSNITMSSLRNWSNSRRTWSLPLQDIIWNIVLPLVSTMIT